MTEVPAARTRAATLVNRGSAPREGGTQKNKDATDRAEAVVREARRRQRRRRLCAIGAVTLGLATAGGLFAAGTFGTGAPRDTSTAGTSHSRGGIGAPSYARATLQFRPSHIAPLSSKNCASRTNQTPSANRGAWVRWSGGCVHDGPALLAISTVRSVTAGYSCTGTVWVDVQLFQSDVARFDRMVRREGTSIVGSVIRYLQLTIYTGDLRHTKRALAGDVNVVGGLPARSPLPREIARDLGAPLHRIPRAWHGFCDGS